MTIGPERNEVDLNKIFKWGDKFIIEDSDGNIRFTAYIRLVGDADLSKARVFALRKSAELRKKLRTENSDERLAFIPEPQTDDKDNLVEIILSTQVRNISDKINKEVVTLFPKEADSDATLERQEEYQKQVDEWPELRAKDIKTALDKEIEKSRKELKKRSLEDLFKEYEKNIINNLCETEMYTKFVEMCVYLGSFRDVNYSKSLFKTYDEFNNLPTPIKEKLIDFYNGLDIKMEELKK